MQLHLKLKSTTGGLSSEVFHRSPSNNNQIVLNKYGTTFDFKSIFSCSNNHDSLDLFDDSCKSMINTKLLKGEDCLLFTLGPSNSGKSHTIFGPSNSGLAFLSLQYIFDQLQDKELSSDFAKLSNLLTNLRKSENLNPSSTPASSSHVEYAVTISMFEIYNDTTKDLLDPSNHVLRGSRSDIITDTMDHKLRPFNCSQFLVTDYESSLKLIRSGLKSRATASTFVNNESSRSHCFVFINLIKVFKGLLTTSRFTVADLAGLERSKLSQTTGVNLKEGSFTNGSLTQLGRCLELAVTKQFNVSLLRTNKLTRLIFNDFAKKKSPISIVVTLDPFGDEGLTIQTLRYVNPIQYQKIIKASATSGNRSVSSSQRSSNTNVPNEIIEEIEQMRAHQSKLQKKVIELEDEIVISENKIRNQFYREHEKQLGTLKDKYSIEKLKLQRNSQKITDVKLEELSQSYRDKILQLKNSLKEKEVQLNAAENDSMQHKQKLSEIHQQYESLKIELNNSKDNYDGELQRLKSFLDNSKCENTSLTNQVVSLEKRSVELSKRINELKSELTSSKKELSEQIASNVELNTRLGQLSKEKCKISEESNNLINELNEKIEYLEHQLSESSDLFVKEKKCLQDVRSELTSTKQELSEQTTSNGELKSRLEELSQEKYKILEESSNSINELNKEIENLKGQLSESTNLLNAEKKSLEDVRSELACKKNELFQHIFLNSELNSKLKEFSQEKTTIEDLGCQLDSLTRLYNTEKKSLEDVRSELASKEKELSEQITSANELNVKLEKLSQEKSKIAQNSVSLSNELGKRIDTLENQLVDSASLFNAEKKALQDVIFDLKEKFRKQTEVAGVDLESDEILNLKRENKLLKQQSADSEKESNQMSEKYEKNLRDLRSQLESAKTKLSLLEEPIVRNSISRSTSPSKSPNKSFGLEINQLLHDDFEIYEDGASQEPSSAGTPILKTSPSKKKDKSVFPAKSRDKSLSPTKKKDKSGSPTKKKDSSASPTKKKSTSKVDSSKSPSKKKVAIVDDIPELPNFKASEKKSVSSKKKSKASKSKNGAKPLLQSGSKFAKEVDFLVNNPFTEKDEDKENVFTVLNSISKKPSPPPLLEVNDQTVFSNSKSKSKKDGDKNSKKRHMSPRKHEKKRLRVNVLEEDLEMSD